MTSSQKAKSKKAVRRTLNPGRKIMIALGRLNIHPARELALYLLQDVEQQGGFNPRLPPAPLTPEVLTIYKMNFECLNCGKAATQGKLYCDEMCTDSAHMVRYIRKCISDERIWDLNIQEALGTKLLMIYGGGYPKVQRRITTNVRATVFERDGGRCAVCGAAADQIDHINGSSADLQNLRAICGSCNRDRAFAGARPATEQEIEFMQSINRDLAQRIAAPATYKVCDHPDWSKLWTKIRGARVREWNRLQDDAESEFEDVDGYLAHAMAKDD